MAAVPVAVFGSRLFVLLAALFCTAHYTGAVDVYAPNELFAENGTYVKLPCTFKSTEVTGSTTSVTWMFTEEGASSTGVMIFFYINGKKYPGQEPRFKDRVTWVGDINSRDVSIKLDKITFKDNGTYSCTVINPPDFMSIPKPIKLRVVEKEHTAEPMEVYAPGELWVESGAQVTLPCAFKSREPTDSATDVMWTYSREGSNCSCVVIFFFIGGRQFPASRPQFKGRVTWAGDISNRDVSIKIDKMSPEDNGTYSCELINQPDISSPKQIKVQVVGKETKGRKKGRKEIRREGKRRTQSAGA